MFDVWSKGEIWWNLNLWRQYWHVNHHVTYIGIEFTDVFVHRIHGAMAFAYLKNWPFKTMTSHCMGLVVGSGGSGFWSFGLGACACAVWWRIWWAGAEYVFYDGYWGGSTFRIQLPPLKKLSHAMWFSVSFEESLDFHKWLGSLGNSFFSAKLFVRSKHLTRTSRTRDASIHSDLFLGTGRFFRGHLLAATVVSAWGAGRFTRVVWWRPIAADGSAGPYVGKLRAIVAGITQPFPWFRGQVWSTFEEVGKRHATQGTLW